MRRGLAFALVAGLAWPAAADPVEGTWRTAPGKSGGYLNVTIAACGAALCGTIAKAFDASGNASGGYEHLGRKLVWGMSAQGGDAYGGGKIWAPDTGKTYASKMQLKGSVLTVKGCVAGGAICRGQEWSRVK
ncbi:MAG: imidazoleglycerol-phosphate dehydratase [Rhodobacteraceae bacterium]|nr:imidazoleglycerol-phosphate dehydratase [Paracoccaceae bacterium]